MSKRARKIYVILNGGAGNQIFPVAAALNVTNPENVHLVSDFCAEPIVVNFFNGCQMKHIKSREVNNLQRTFYNINLRASTLEGRIIGKIVRSILTPISSILFSIYLKEIVLVKIGAGVGFSKLNFHFKTNVVIGYFQSHRYLINFQLNSKNQVFSTEALNFIEKYQNVEKLVLHVRLGDYRNDHKIGSLGANYFSRALGAASDISNFEKIWLFSNEPEKAINMIPDQYQSQVLVVPASISDPLELLALMKLGSIYVISNSTLSLLGAYFSENPAAPVFAPKPWFANLKEPRFLLPDNWTRIPRG